MGHCYCRSAKKWRVQACQRGPHFFGAPLGPDGPQRSSTVSCLVGGSHFRLTRAHFRLIRAHSRLTRAPFRLIRARFRLTRAHDDFGRAQAAFVRLIGLNVDPPVWVCPAVGATTTAKPSLCHVSHWRSVDEFMVSWRIIPRTAVPVVGRLLGEESSPGILVSSRLVRITWSFHSQEQRRGSPTSGGHGRRGAGAPPTTTTRPSPRATPRRSSNGGWGRARRGL